MTLLSKFFKESLKITGFLCFSFPVYANELCERFYKEPIVSTRIDYGKVNFESIPKSKILSFEKLKNPDATLGLTSADFSIKYDFGFEKYKIDEGICTIISSINFTIGYKNIDVLIEDKYEQGSCEYNAIKEHELGHVDIYKNELKYYGNLVLDELKRISADVGPIFFKKNVSGKKIGRKIQKIVFENNNINLLKSKLENALVDKNSFYDSKEEYNRVRNLCQGW